VKVGRLPDDRVWLTGFVVIVRQLVSACLRARQFEIEGQFGARGRVLMHFDSEEGRAVSQQVGGNGIGEVGSFVGPPPRWWPASSSSPRKDYAGTLPVFRYAPPLVAQNSAVRFVRRGVRHTKTAGGNNREEPVAAAAQVECRLEKRFAIARGPGPVGHRCRRRRPRPDQPGSAPVSGISTPSWWNSGTDCAAARG